MDALSVRWKSPNEELWRGAFNLSEEWKDKNVYMFTVMADSGSSVKCELL